MTEIIQVKDLSYKYEEDAPFWTLDKVSFHVKQGEWLSIIGHNGSGKSTTVRLIDGLLEANQGEIYISGDLLTPDNVWEKRRQIGMVFQNPDNQFVGATVEDDVAFGLENQGIPLEEMRERVQEALELVGMSEFKTKEPARLSGGQKQRVAIAGVVALRPAIMILDEATSMLDPEGRLELIKVVQRIKEKYKITVLSITHDLDEVALSDRVIVMKKGQIESISSPGQLFLRSDLNQLGLEAPFTVQLAEKMRQEGLALPSGYFTEEELEEEVWELISKM
ncbi:TPA: energy-coupling factor transporter ATPase [Streptococcus suis]|nr:energy-coupling factor transporter ATPase [Streptococcus suis]